MRRIAFLCIAWMVIGSGLSAKPLDTLRIGVYHSPPFVILDDQNEIEGVSAWLWGRLAQEIEMPHIFVHYQQDEPLKHLLDDLEGGHIDLSINPIAITSERYDSIDFTFPFYIGNLTMARLSQTKLESFADFFKGFMNRRVLNMTLLLFGFVILFGMIIWRVERNNRHFGKGIRGLLSGFWWSAVTMTTVGYGDTVPKSHVGRLIAFFWMLFSLIIISFFVASITSSLTVKNLTDADLAPENFKQSRVATVHASATEDYLKRNFFRDINLYPNLTEGLTALRDEEVDIFVYDEPWLAYQVYHNPAFRQLEILPLRFQMEQYAMPMRKKLDHGLEAIITEVMLEAIESKDWTLLLSEYQLEHL